MTAPAVPLRANSDLVAVAWVAGVPGLTAGMVATALPTPPGTWADVPAGGVNPAQAGTGFVTVRAAPGSENAAYALHGPVITCDVYALRMSSSKPPWNKASNIAMAIVEATKDYALPARDVALPTGYPAARVTGAWVVQAPRRAYGDQGSYAHLVLDLQLKWVELP